MNQSTPSIKHSQSICRFGIARSEITPPVGIYHRMWGAALHDRATGVHRPLTATALVFQSSDAGDELTGRQIVVAVDHVLLWADEMETLLDIVAEQAAVPREQIAICFSHTHAAGLMDLARRELPGGNFIAEYLEELSTEIVKIVRQAVSALANVNITYGTGSCMLAAHRDCWDATEEQFVCGFNPDGPTDDTVMIARVNRMPDGKVLAVIVNYACHPTTLAWQNTLISPDFVGAMRDTVEKQTRALCVFLQGASGDLGPREGFVGDTHIADSNGRQLGYAVLSALCGFPPSASKYVYAGSVLSGATIGTWQYESLDKMEREPLTRWQLECGIVDLPYRVDLPTRKKTEAEMAVWKEREQTARESGNEEGLRNCRAMVERMQRRLTKLEALPPGRAFPFPVTLWRMGDAIWIALEGELYHWFQVELRERFPDTPIVIITLTNGSRCSYLPTAETYGKGIYQETIAVLEKGCLEKLLEAVCGQIQLCLEKA